MRSRFWSSEILILYFLDILERVFKIDKMKLLLVVSTVTTYFSSDVKSASNKHQHRCKIVDYKLTCPPISYVKQKNLYTSTAELIKTIIINAQTGNHHFPNINKLF